MRILTLLVLSMSVAQAQVVAPRPMPRPAVPASRPAAPDSAAARVPAVVARPILPAGRLELSPVRWDVEYGRGEVSRETGHPVPFVRQSALRIRGHGLGADGESFSVVLAPEGGRATFVTGPCASPPPSAETYCTGASSPYVSGMTLRTQWREDEVVADFRCREALIRAGVCLPLADLVGPMTEQGWEVLIKRRGTGEVVWGPVAVPPVPPPPGLTRRLDADGDGASDIASGGLDCDDGDPNRYPTNHEVCDRLGRDEDCNAATFGDTDLDRDGHVDAMCANVIDGVERSRGTDCDDRDPAVHPGRPEVRDGKDNDCDGDVDE